jgi:starch-binding outer membrane protein, SusD/RagB family
VTSVRAYLRISMLVAATFSLAACDLTISNPGPVADATLDDPTTHRAVVNGMSRAMSRALGWLAYTGGIAAREIAAAGSANVATYGVSFKQRAGLLDPGLSETNDHWRYAQQARWVAEDGVRRMREANPAEFSTSALAAEALVYVGFANRLLGENMCDGVIDGGPLEPRSVYFTRAVAAFTEAITVAAAAENPALERAARAGRASALVWLDDWGAAAADARAIPSTFLFQAAYSSLELDQYNRIYWSNANQPLRAHTVFGTFYESYYKSTSDPRTPWSTNPAFPRGTMNVTWYFQTKYRQHAAPINLVSGREMRLIVAESQLRAGDWQAAMGTINALRAEVGVPPWPASGQAEAWTALGRERGIELWLEGRRLGDLFRWTAAKVPGTFDDMTGRDLCFPIGVSERDTNSNL